MPLVVIECFIVALEQLVDMQKKPRSPPVDRPAAWDSDRVKEKTSLEVLLDWFARPKNYARWRMAHRNGPENKTKLSEEINRQMHKQDITCRSDGGIQRKAYQVFKCMATANELLKERGMGLQVSLEKCEESIKHEIRQLCPYFEQLAPVVNVPTPSPERSLSKGRSAKQRLCQEEIRQRLALEDESIRESQAIATGVDDDYEDDLVEEAPPKRAHSNPSSTDENIDSESEDSSRASPETVKTDREPTDSERKSTRKRWGGDHDGVSSLDILLHWLATGNNYSHWRRLYSKVGTCSEINDLLHAQGIYHRSNSDIRHKVNRLVQSIAKAKVMLRDQDLGAGWSLKDCGEDLGREILRVCPHFESLSHVVVGMNASGNDAESTQPVLTTDEEKDEDNGSSSGDELEEEQAPEQEQGDGFAPEEVEEPPATEAQGEEGFTPEEEEDAVDEEQEDETPDAAEIGQNASATIRIPEPRPKPMVVCVSDFKLSPLQQQQLERRCSQMEFNHQRASIELENLRQKGRVELDAMRARCELELTSARKKREIELGSAQLQAQLEIKRQKCDMENVRARNEYTLVVERELARQKLRSAGVAQAEVDRLLPSKQTQL